MWLGGDYVTVGIPACMAVVRRTVAGHDVNQIEVLSTRGIRSVNNRMLVYPVKTSTIWPLWRRYIHAIAAWKVVPAERGRCRGRAAAGADQVGCAIGAANELQFDTQARCDYPAASVRCPAGFA